MLIRCSACNSKYLVNSADLKPDGRMVECASCGHQWYQELSTEEEILFSSAHSSKNDHKQTQDITNTKIENNQKNKIKNLPSTVVMKHKTSVMNSFLILISLLSLCSFICLILLLRKLKSSSCLSLSKSLQSSIFLSIFFIINFNKIISLLFKVCKLKFFKKN